MWGIGTELRFKNKWDGRVVRIEGDWHLVEWFDNSERNWFKRCHLDKFATNA